MPVISGFIASRARWCSSYSETSPIQRRTCPNNAHITLQDVPHLRKLINTGLADKLAHTGNAGVVLNLEHRTGHLVLIQQVVQFCLCIGAHRAELIKLEELSIAPDTLLTKNQTSRWIIYYNCDGRSQHDRRQHHQCGRGQNHILSSAANLV